MPSPDATDAATPSPPHRPQPERVLADAARAAFIPWGLRDYGDVLAHQHALHARRVADRIPDTWLVGEHPTVVTQGVRGSEADLLTAARYPVFRINRGGQTTIHNPGQLVIYPIVKTQGGLLAQAWLSRLLLAAVSDWLANLTGVATQLEKGKPGLFVDGRKVAAIGISIHRRVAMHGIAVNVCNDLAPWQSIIPCGEPERRPITLSEAAGRPLDPADLVAAIPAWLHSAWGYRRIDTLADAD
ncbi:MAG: Octanoyltransferase [candidate division BRC1 bacterium ADurb.BinA292]|nr:MAG: Octanoyltransferase [candidate division BRC1 bacterium ADurb.BinA292]